MSTTTAPCAGSPNGRRNAAPSFSPLPFPRSASSVSRCNVPADAFPSQRRRKFCVACWIHSAPFTSFCPTIWWCRMARLVRHRSSHHRRPLAPPCPATHPPSRHLGRGDPRCDPPARPSPLDQTLTDLPVTPSRHPPSPFSKIANEQKVNFAWVQHFIHHLAPQTVLRDSAFPQREATPQVVSEGALSQNSGTARVRLAGALGT